MGKTSLLSWLGLGRKTLLGLDEFRMAVRNEMLRRHPAATIKDVADDELDVDGGFINVSRAYAYYRERPRELDFFVHQLAESIFIELHDAQPDDLILLVRPESFNPDGDDDATGLTRSLPGGLITVVAVDTPTRYVFSPADELSKELGLSRDDIWARARSNLLARLDVTPPTYKSGRVVTIKTGTGLASSLLAVEEFWDHPNLANLGDLVVSPIERDQLIIAKSDETELIASMRRLAAGFETPEFLCDRLLLRRNGAWEDFE